MAATSPVQNPRLALIVTHNSRPLKKGHCHCGIAVSSLREATDFIQFLSGSMLTACTNPVDQRLGFSRLPHSPFKNLSLLSSVGEEVKSQPSERKTNKKTYPLPLIPFQLY